MSESKKSSEQEKYDQLRDDYPFLEYVGYEANIDNAGIHVKYEFNLADKFTFRPGFSIPRKRFFQNFPDIEIIQSPFYQNLLFV